MANIIDITPHEIAAAATNMETSLLEFTRAYTNIYSATGDLRVQFQGAASSTYNQRIEAYRGDFLRVEQSVKEFIQFLQNYSQTATRVEGHLVGTAGNLPTGVR